MIDDTKEIKKLLDTYSPTNDDYLESIKIINDFFDTYLIPKIIDRSWNMGIRIERKGSQLYLDQKLSKKDLALLRVFSDSDLNKNENIVTGKSIIIFDDSIKTGEHVRRVLDRIATLASEISVAVLLSRKDTLIDLKLKYPKVIFYSEMIASKEKFSECYLKRIQPYLDSICLPLQREHPLLSIDFNNSFNEKVVIDIFKKYGNISNDECKKFSYIDGDKKMFEFKEDTFNDLPIIQNLRELGFLEKDFILEDSVIIRIYIRQGLVRRLIIQPIILEGVITQRKQDRGAFDSIDRFIKNKIIYQFLISKVLPNIIDAQIGLSRFTVIFE